MYQQRNQCRRNPRTVVILIGPGGTVYTTVRRDINDRAQRTSFRYACVVGRAVRLDTNDWKQKPTKTCTQTRLTGPISLTVVCFRPLGPCARRRTWTTTHAAGITRLGHFSTPATSVPNTQERVFESQRFTLYWDITRGNRITWKMNTAMQIIYERDDNGIQRVLISTHFFPDRRRDGYTLCTYIL